MSVPASRTTGSLTSQLAVSPLAAALVVLTAASFVVIALVLLRPAADEVGTVNAPPPRPGSTWNKLDGEARNALRKLQRSQADAVATRRNFDRVSSIDGETRRYVVERTAYLRAEIARIDGLESPTARDLETRDLDADELRRLSFGR